MVKWSKASVIALALVFVFMFTSVAGAANLQFVYYQNSSNQMVKADYETASANGGAMFAALREGYTYAVMNAKSLFLELDNGKVIDWGTNINSENPLTWSEAQETAGVAAPAVDKELKNDGTIGDPAPATKTVSSVTAVNSTTLSVTFEGMEPVEITLETPLTHGQTEVTFTYEGIQYTATLSTPWVDQAVVDAQAAAAVDGQIAALPAVDALLLTDKAAVEAARASYNVLTDAQKALVTKLDVLQAAEAKIAELEAQAAYADLKAGIEATVAAYEGLANGDLSTQALIDAANAGKAAISLNGLTDADKAEFQARIDAADAKVAAAQQVIYEANKQAAINGVRAAILALPADITLENKDAVNSAKAKYDVAIAAGATDSQIGVNLVKLLNNAITKIAQLEQAVTDKSAAIAAAQQAIIALPDVDTITIADKVTVDGAKAKYDVAIAAGATDAEIGTTYVAILNSAVAKMAELTYADLKAGVEAAVTTYVNLANGDLSTQALIDAANAAKAAISLDGLTEADAAAFQARIDEADALVAAAQQKINDDNAYATLKASVEAAVTTYVNLAKGDLTTQELIDAANAAKAAISLDGLTEADAAAFQARIDEADALVTAAQQAIDATILASAEKAVSDLENAVLKDLTVEANLVVAESLVQPARLAVGTFGNLVGDAEKLAELNGRVDAAETTVTNARTAFDAARDLSNKVAAARVAVEALETAVVDLSTQEKVDNANALVAPAREAIAVLPVGNENIATLTTRVDNAAAAIANGQQIVTATAAVVMAEESLLEADLANAQVLVAALPVSETKDSLQARVDNVQARINDIIAQVNDAVKAGNQVKLYTALNQKPFVNVNADLIATYIGSLTGNEETIAAIQAKIDEDNQDAVNAELAAQITAAGNAVNAAESEPGNNDLYNTAFGLVQALPDDVPPATVKYDLLVRLVRVKVTYAANNMADTTLIAPAQAAIDLLPADAEGVTTKADLQAQLNDVIAVGPVVNAANQIALLDALNAGEWYVRVNPEYIADYEGSITGNETKIADVQDVIDGVNETKARTAITALYAAPTRAGYNAALALVNTWVKDDVAPDTTKADFLTDLAEIDALISVNEATTVAALQTALDKLEATDDAAPAGAPADDFDIATVNANLMEQYLDALTTAAAADKDTVAEIQTIINDTTADAIAAAVEAINNLAVDADDATVKAALQRLADATAVEVHPFDMATVHDEGLCSYRDAFLANLPLANQADVEAQIAIVNDPATVLNDLRDNGAADADKLLAVLKHWTLDLPNVVDANKDLYFADLAAIRGVISDPATVADVDDVKSVLDISNAVARLNAATDDAAARAALTDFAIYTSDPYVNFTAAKKLEVASLVRANMPNGGYAKIADVTAAIIAQEAARDSMIAAVNDACDTTRTITAVEEALAGLDYDEYNNLTPAQQVDVADAFLANYPLTGGAPVADYFTTLTSIYTAINAAIDAVL